MLYNDGDGSTGYDREFAMHLSEVWADSHWADAHIQSGGMERLPGRLLAAHGCVGYPDTLAPNGSVSIFPSIPCATPTGT